MAGKKKTEQVEEAIKEVAEKATKTATEEQETKEAGKKKTETIDPIVVAMLGLNSRRKQLTKKEKQADIYAKMAKIKIVRN